MKTLLISILILSAHFYVNAQELNQEKLGMADELADSKTPGLCYKQTPKCNYRQLTQAEVDTATAMSDEVAFQLKKIDQLERAQNREFKIAIIGRSGTDLGHFQVLKDSNASGQRLSLPDLIGQIKYESDQKNMSSEAGPTGAIDFQILRSYFDRDRKMDFSHVAIAMKNHPKSDQNFHWQVMHLLWTCDMDPARNVNEGDRSYIWEEGLGAVFADDMKRYRAQIMVPKQQLQNRLESILLKEKIGAQWHNKKYNAAALSDDLDQQNSNQWVLEVLAAATQPAGVVTDRTKAQAVLAETHFMATKVTPRGLYSLITLPFVGKLLPGTVCMKRQKYFKQGFGEIISVLSIEEYMRNNEMLQYEPFIVELDDEFNFVKQEKDKP